MAVFLVMTHDSDVIATAANLNLRGFIASAFAMADTLQERVLVHAVRLNVFHEPLVLGEKFGPDFGGRIVDQSWEVDPSKDGTHAAREVPT